MKNGAIAHFVKGESPAHRYGVQGVAGSNPAVPMVVSDSLATPYSVRGAVLFSVCLPE
jgi:hypothetical protein